MDVVSFNYNFLMKFTKNEQFVFYAVIKNNYFFKVLKPMSLIRWGDGAWSANKVLIPKDILWELPSIRVWFWDYKNLKNCFKI